MYMDRGTQTTRIKAAAAIVDCDCYDIGYRYLDASAEVGDELDNSYVWDGDEWTNEELPGTCAFSTIDAVIEYAKYSKGFIAVLQGAIVEHGELESEIIIEGAEVAVVISI